MSEPSSDDAVIQELSERDPSLVEILNERDSAARLLPVLRNKFSPARIQREEDARTWELVGLWYLNRGRLHEALAVFSALYQQMTAAQTTTRLHKGMPLCWVSDCYAALGFPVYAKRFLM